MSQCGYFSGKLFENFSVLVDKISIWK